MRDRSGVRDPPDVWQHVGQTGRCVNIRTREHDLNLNKESEFAHLSAHCKAFKCEPRFDNVNIIDRSNKQTAREALEAFYIEKFSEVCISEPPLQLHSSEIRFLEH